MRHGRHVRDRPDLEPDCVQRAHRRFASRSGAGDPHLDVLHAAFLRGAPSPLTVELDGGELTVEVSDDLDVRLTGWAEPVCSGELSSELLAALAAATE